MIKYTILLFNLMGLFLYQLFFQTNVTATQAVPASASAGSSFVVEVTINKADVSGFAKYQEDLPKGFTAVAVQKQGATILSSDNAIKFIWASLPSDATIKISFKVTVDASVSGSQSLSGKFLYVVNNERQEADVAASSINITGGAPAVASAANANNPTNNPATTETTQPNNAAATNQPAANNPTANATQPATNNPAANNEQPAANNPTSNPTANTNQPVTNNPVANVTQPAANNPSTSNLTANTNQPVTNNPVANASQPAANNPSTSNPTANTNQPVTNNPTVNATQPAANNPSTGNPATNNPAANTSQPVTNNPAANANQTPTQHVSGYATRALSATSVAPAGDITVSVTLHKGNLTGFAKLEETIPAGVIASEGDKMGASFTYVDNQVKFVWLNLPADSVITVSYKLTPSSTVSGNQSVNGEFSYLQNDNAEKFVIPASTFTVGTSSQPAVANNPPSNNPPINNPPVTNTSTVTPVTNETTNPVTATSTVTPVATADTTHKATTQIVQTNQPANNPPANNPPTTSTNPPANDMTNAVTPHVSGAQGGVMYRVQIMALHNAVKPSYLSNKFKISEKINEEMLEGYTKYTVGRFNEYKPTRDHREELRNKGVEGPFVVAFNDGKRITVQEALMITHQQWYK